MGSTNVEPILPTQQDEKTRRRKRVLIVLAIFTVTAMIISFPVPFKITDHVIGNPESDLWTHLWGYWRTEKAFFVEHQFPYQEDHLNYPYGGKLYHIDFLNSLFMLPLRKLFGLVFGYNLLVWTHVVLGALAMYLLARRFVDRFLPAVLAGFSFGFSPYILTFPMASGVSERLNIAWFPLFFLFYFRLLDTGKVRNIFYAALMFALATIGCWKYGLFLFLLTCFLSVFVLIRPAAVRYLGKKEKPDLLKTYVDLIGKKLLPLALVCGLLAVPISLSASSSVSVLDPEAIYQRETSLFWDGKSQLHGVNLFALKDYFVPSENGLLQTHLYDKLYQTVYIGYSLLLLGLLSLFAKRKYAYFLFPTSVLFLILALGPRIVIYNGAPPMESPIFYFMARVVPFMTALQVPWEFTFPAVFCLSLASAMGFEWVLSKIQDPKWRRIGAVEILAIFLIEIFIISPAIVPIPASRAYVPAFYRTLARDPESFAIFDYPMRRQNSNMIPEEYFFYQTVHKKPIPYAVNKGWIDRTPFWVDLTFYQQGISESLPEDRWEMIQAKTFLAENHFRYFLLHKSLIEDAKKAPYRAFFSKMFGDPIREDENLVVYKIM